MRSATVPGETFLLGGGGLWSRCSIDWGTPWILSSDQERCPSISCSTSKRTFASSRVCQVRIQWKLITICIHSRDSNTSKITAPLCSLLWLHYSHCTHLPVSCSWFHEPPQVLGHCPPSRCSSFETKIVPTFSASGRTFTAWLQHNNGNACGSSRSGRRDSFTSTNSTVAERTWYIWCEWQRQNSKRQTLV